MRVFIALLTAVIVIPIAGALGYFANPDPAPPSLQATIQRELKEIPGTGGDEYFYVVTKGKLKGQVADAGFVAQFVSEKELKEQGALAGAYIVRSCSLWSTTGRQGTGTDPVVINFCTQREVSKRRIVELVYASAAGPVG